MRFELGLGHQATAGAGGVLILVWVRPFRQPHPAGLKIRDPFRWLHEAFGAVALRQSDVDVSRGECDQGFAPQTKKINPNLFLGKIERSGYFEG